MKKAVLISLPLLILGGLTYWLATHAYITVVVDTSTSNKTGVQLLNQSDGSKTKLESDSGQFKRLVRSGSYEVLANQNEKNGFAITKVGGFLSNNEVRVILTPEVKRIFIGNEPLPCMGLANDVLYSSACGDTVSNVQLHLPANSATPTYVKKLPTPLRSFAEGYLQTKDGSLIIAKAPSNTDGQGPPHAAFTISKDGLKFISELRGLGSSKYYSVAPYKEGFVVYNFQIGEMFYFSSPSSQPEKINIPETLNDLNFYSLSSFKDDLAIIYSSKKTEEPANIDQAAGLELHSEVADNTSNKAKEQSIVTVTKAQNRTSYSFDFAPLQVRLCATNALCVLKDNGELHVYDIATQKQKQLLKLRDVVAIETLGESFIVVRTNEIINFNLATKTGKVLYTLGSYRFCGLRSAGPTTLLCVTNANNSKAVMALNLSIDNSDSIDKKVAELSKSNAVKTASIYGNFIYITPNLGEPTFQQSTGGFGYDEAIKKQRSKEIDAEISKIGFGPSYQIINNYR